nr:MAG TPA: hypothetical protein [Caudoviricetes sp.]
MIFRCKFTPIITYAPKKCAMVAHLYAMIAHFF